MVQTVYIVDDERTELTLLTAQLEKVGLKTAAFSDPRRALEAILTEPPDAVITDVVMPGLSGIDLLRQVRARFPALPVIVITGKQANGDAESAFEAGATDFLTKPVSPHDLTTRVRKALEDAPAQELLRRTVERLFADIVGTHPRIEEVRRFVQQVAAVPRAPALLRGESGTGKNQVARALHHASEASRYRFVEVNCAALPENLIEAELFGHEKGAFTGAGEAKKGLVEAAHLGTLFLDEVGALAPALQAKVLTFLESKRFRRLGSTEERSVDLRILAATNADLEAEVASSRFREDLFYRLNTAQVTLPPLREIRTDIPQLTRHFAKRGAEYFAMPVPEVAPDCLRGLMEYDWPGNARELRNAVERALIFSDGKELWVTPPSPTGPPRAPQAPVARTSRDGDFVAMPRGLTLEEVERRYIEQTLEETGGSVAEAAERLGLTRKALWLRRRKHGLIGSAEGG